MPTDAAIVSAVLKPIPRCRPPAGMAPLDRLDRLVAVLLVDLHRQGRGDAHALQEDHHLLIARCSAHAAGIRAHRFGPRPGTSIGRAGSSSMTCMISTPKWSTTVSYTHLRAHETRHDLVCRLLLEKKKKIN